MMSACPSSLKYRNEQKSTLLCLRYICIFHSLDPGSLPALLSSHFLSSCVCLSSLLLFLSVCIAPFLSFLEPQEKKSYKIYGAVNQISPLELWMGERTICMELESPMLRCFWGRWCVVCVTVTKPAPNASTHR